MNLRTIVCLLAASMILGACSDGNNQIKSRTWKDVHGRTMQAKLTGVDLNSNEAFFLKNNGKRYRYRIDLLSKVDQQYIREKADSHPDLIKLLAEQRTEFEKALTKNLIQFAGGRIKNLYESDFEANDYYAIYYSAHWCAPCRKFTPQLVSFYNSYSSKHDNFEIIFVSSDRNEIEMENYMKQANMPWPVLKFDQKNSAHPATKYLGKGIPCLVLLDNRGNVLAHSYVANKYVGPDAVMNKLKERLDL